MPPREKLVDAQHQSHERNKEAILHELKLKLGTWINASYEEFKVSQKLSIEPTISLNEGAQKLTSIADQIVGSDTLDASDAASALLEAIDHFLENHSTELHAKDAAVGAFITNWYETLFAEEFYNPVRTAPLPVLMRSIVRYSNIPALQNSFAASLTVAGMEQLDRHQPTEGVQLLEAVRSKLSLTEQIDFLHLLPTFYYNSQVIAMGDNDLEQAPEAIRQFAKELSQRNDLSPFVSYASISTAAFFESTDTRQLIKQFKKIEQDPRYNARLIPPISKKQRRQSIDIWRHVQPEDGSSTEDIAAPIARDAIGTFDPTQTLQNATYISWRDIQKSPTKYIIPFFPIHTLNHPHQKETALLLQTLHRSDIKPQLENDLGIQLTDLSLREQIQLLSYLASVDTKTAQNGFAAIRQFGLPGARAFLSCEYGQEYGHAILSIANNLEKEAAAAIFQKYAELIDLTDRSTEELLKDVLVTEHQQVIDRSKLDEELLRRGKELIAAFAKRIAEQRNPLSTQEVLKEIERAKQDVILMAALFRSTYKGKEASVDFSELKGLTLDTIDPQTLNKQQHKALETELKDILKANWVDKGLPAMEMAMHGLEEGLSEKKEKTIFFTLKKNNHPIAFCRFDDRPDLAPDARYVGSFNVSPDLRGSAIGMAFFHEILKREGKEHTLHAHVHADDRIGARYVEEFGFAITDVETDAAPNQEPVTWFTLQRFPDQADKEPISQKRERETRQEQFFNFPMDRAKMLDWVRRETTQGNVISQYIVEPRQGDQPERRRFTSIARKTLSRAA